MNTISIIQNNNIDYPSSGNYAPEKIFPEYPFKNSAPGENKIYQMMRDCFNQMKLDRQNFDTPAWNPLGQWIKKGDRVFILPNLVMHRRENESKENFLGKCSNGSVLRPLLDYAFKAAGDIELISYGNASLQACQYDTVAEETGMVEVADFYQKTLGGPFVGPYDLRGIICQRGRFGDVQNVREQNKAEHIAIDLGKDSFLDEFFQSSRGPVEFRVGDYDHRETMAYHGRGKHVYVINKRLLDADVIISLPKLKTHQKVGITCALKGTVGAIARKECLAHHRKGGPAEHGDEYTYSTLPKKVTSDLIDKASRSINNWYSTPLQITSKIMAHLLCRVSKDIMGGAWYGNDTAWRMALDIARILRFGRPDGTLADTPQRQHLALVDGIVAGEGEGPLRPQAKHMGVILFGSDICWVDYVCALVMGFDPRKIPLIKNSFKKMRYPLTDNSNNNVQVLLNGSEIKPGEIGTALQGCFMPTRGWLGHIESELCCCKKFSGKNIR